MDDDGLSKIMDGSWCLARFAGLRTDDDEPGPERLKLIIKDLLKNNRINCGASVKDWPLNFIEENFLVLRAYLREKAKRLVTAAVVKGGPHGSLKLNS
jgi:hypothetical protein